MHERRNQFKLWDGILPKAATAVLAVFALIVVFADFTAPYDPATQSRNEPNAPATKIHFPDGDEISPLSAYIHPLELVDPLERRYEEDLTRKFSLGSFVPGEPYRLLGLISMRTRLFGVQSTEADAPRVNLLGTDALGRDRFSRLLFAIRFSLIVCPLGVGAAWLIGMAVGLISGYAGRWVDIGLMGIADTMLSLPTLILILTARAAFPLDLPPLRAAMLLIFIFSLTGWAEVARLARGLVRSLKEREFVMAARATGLTEVRILIRHILPNAMPTLLTQAAVMLPYFLLAEVALSFLGVGLQEPQPSLGNMLAAAADVNQLKREPFLVLAPGLVIFLFVAAVRLVGRERNELTPSNR
jgi:peptide/nickel transport system permease protein